MSNEKTFTLIMKLHERTAAGKVNWEVTSSSSRYVTATPNHSIVISEEGDDYYLTIIDEWDDVIERINDVELAPVSSEALDRMRALFIMARRNARGVDKAIDDILHSFDDDDDFF